VTASEERDSILYKHFSTIFCDATLSLSFQCNGKSIVTRALKRYVCLLSHS